MSKDIKDDIRELAREMRWRQDYVSEMADLGPYYLYDPDNQEAEGRMRQRIEEIRLEIDKLLLLLPEGERVVPWE